MTRIAIVTDSAANIPADIRRDTGVTVVPVKLHLDGQLYRDEIDMSAGRFYSLLRASPDMDIKTASPSVGDFAGVYGELASRADAIVSIHVAGALSGTFAAATQAAALASSSLEGMPIRVIDSRSASMACGFAVLAAAKAAAAGSTLDEVVQRAEEVASRALVVAALDTVRYVQRTGRVPAIAGLAGSVLHIRPYLCINRGRAVLLGVRRTMRRALERILDLTETRAGGRALHAAVLHADAPDSAAFLHSELARRCHCRELLTTEFTPVMGAAAGPGLAGVAYYPEDPA